MYHFISLFSNQCKVKGHRLQLSSTWYCACQRAESTLLSTERQPSIESQNVFWHNILPHQISFYQALKTVSVYLQTLRSSFPQQKTMPRSCYGISMILGFKKHQLRSQPLHSSIGRVSVCIEGSPLLCAGLSCSASINVCG